MRWLGGRFEAQDEFSASVSDFEYPASFQREVWPKRRETSQSAPEFHSGQSTDKSLRIFTQRRTSRRSIPELGEVISSWSKSCLLLVQGVGVNFNSRIRHFNSRRGRRSRSIVPRHFSVVLIIPQGPRASQRFQEERERRELRVSGSSIVSGDQFNCTERSRRHILRQPSPANCHPRSHSFVLMLPIHFKGISRQLNQVKRNKIHLQPAS